MPECPYCNSPISAGTAQCPNCQTAISNSPSDPQPIQATRLEAVQNETPQLGRSVQPTAKEKGAKTKVPLVRPTRRPPTAIVFVLDDGGERGEAHRVRTEKVIVGRDDGDIVIQHDEGMSGRHFEFGRTIVEGEFTWHVKDLGSTNGTFARVVSAPLSHNQELMIGTRRYRFDAAPRAEPSAVPQGERKVTQKYAALKPEQLISATPALVDIADPANERRYALALDSDQHGIGADPTQCTVVIDDDPFVNPLHAVIKRDKKRRWIIDDGNSTNGTWLKITKVRVFSEAEVYAGEQRFLIKVP